MLVRKTKISSNDVLREYIEKKNLNYLIRSKEKGDCVELELRKIINEKMEQRG